MSAFLSLPQFMRCRRSDYRFLAALGALVLSACQPGQESAENAAADIVMRSHDGVALAATLYQPAAAHPPGLVLIHRGGASRASWHVFAERLRRAGYMALAVDLRGHGGSIHQGGKRLTYRNFSTQDWLKALEDVLAAKEALIAHGADPENLAVLGEGLGGSLAAYYARIDPDMQAVVLISPGLDYQGVTVEEVIVGLRERPVLLVTAEGDAYSAAAAAALKEAASGFCELRQYPGAAHGTGLFASSSNAMDQIIQWLEPIIGPREA